MIWKEDIDQTFRIYHLARWVWKEKGNKSPKGVYWEEWFRKHIGMSIYEFMDWSLEKNLKEKVAQDIKNNGYKKRLADRLRKLNDI